MGARRIFAAAATATALTAAPALAAPFPLADCTRTTHPSHGGEAGHRDLGAGRVAFAEWWSQEGVYTDIVVSDCATGETLRTRTREERVTQRAPFDRTDAALAILERHLAGAPAFFRLTALAEALRHTGEDIAIFATGTEFCACAARYPEHRGDKTAFEGI